MRDQVEQLKQLGFSAAAIGLGEEYEEDEKAARMGKCVRSVTAAACKCIFWSLPLEVAIVWAHAPCKICFKPLSICSQGKNTKFSVGTFFFTCVYCDTGPGPAVIRTVCKQ